MVSPAAHTVFKNVQLQPESPIAGSLDWSTLRQRKSAIVSLCTDWWLIELLSWGLAVICILTAAGILAFHDNRPLPSHPPVGLSLNAYLSILSAVAKLALAVPLEEALGSQKYLWFSVKDLKRPLMDFERFDDAARGPLGALMLLQRTRARWVYQIFKAEEFLLM